MTGHKLRNRSRVAFFLEAAQQSQEVARRGKGGRQVEGDSTITSGAQCTKAKDRAESDSGLQIWKRKRKLIKYVEQTLRVCIGWCVCMGAPVCVLVFSAFYCVFVIYFTAVFSFSFEFTLDCILFYFNFQHVFTGKKVH